MATFFRKLNLAVSGVLMLACFAAAAQDVSQAELAECASQPTAAEKLACYEALTDIPGALPRQPETEAPAPARPVEQEVIEQSGTFQESVVETEPAASAAIATEVAAEPPAAPASPESVSPPAAAVDARSSAAEDLGKEQLGIEEKTVDPFPVTAVVNEVTQSGSGRLYFYFSNGQVWRQIEPRRFFYPKNETFEVTVSQGMMGEYRLRVGGKGPMVRVRRVE